MFELFGFKRIRIYKIANNQLIGLYAKCEPALVEFIGKEFPLAKLGYNQIVLAEGNAKKFSLPILKYKGESFDKSVFDYLNIDESTEWIDLPIIYDNNINNCYYIGLDKGKGVKTNVDAELMEIMNIFSKSLAISLKNIDYYDRILEINKNMADLLDIHNRKSHLYEIVNKLRSQGYYFDEWTIYLHDDNLKRLKVVSSSNPILFEAQNDIKLDEAHNLSEKEDLIKKMFKTNDISYIQIDSDILIVSCLNTIKNKIGAILLKSKDNKFIECINSTKAKIALQNHLNMCGFILGSKFSKDQLFREETSEILTLLHDLHIPMKMCYSDEIKELNLDELQLIKAAIDAQQMMEDSFRINGNDDQRNKDYIKLFDFDELILPIRLIADYYAKKRGLKIIYSSVGEKETFENKVDYLRLRIVLFLVLDNAIKYSANTREPGSLPSGDITVECTILKDSIFFKISNFGMPFPDELADGKFDGRRGQHNIPGKGIGLQHANNLLSQINGKFEVMQKSNPTIIKIVVKI